MRTCVYCGEEIDFRYVDGQRTPIHVNGNRCSGHAGSSVSTFSKPFGSVISYVNPNAHCPVCNETVYFYQSPSGGRVFFDYLGWPWPKHACTDNPRAQSGSVKRLPQSLHKSFLSQSGEPLRIFDLTELVHESEAVFLKLSEVGQPLVVLRLSISIEALKENDISVKDLQQAPAFVVRFYEDHRLLEFISGRKHKIDKLIVPRTVGTAANATS